MFPYLTIDIGQPPSGADWRLEISNTQHRPSKRHT